MSGSMGSNIYNYGKRRGEAKTVEYRMGHRSRRSRPKISKVDLVARIVLYAIAIAVAVGLSVYFGRRLGGGRKDIERDVPASESLQK